jgi:hypothetical protein
MEFKTLYKTENKDFEIEYYLDRNPRRTIIGMLKRAKGKDDWWRYEIVLKPEETMRYWEWYDSDYGRFSNGIVCRSPPAPQELIDDLVESLKNGKIKVFDELELSICKRP